MALTSAQQRSALLKQPSMHYLFLDLDPLLTTIKTHMLAQPTVYSLELTRADGAILHPERLTALLDGQHQPQPALVVSRSGSYFNGGLEVAHALQAVGWNMKKKGAIDHRTLENMMEKTLEQVGAYSAWDAPPKTMVLATGELRPPTQSCIQAYLQSGWRVTLFSLQRCWKQVIDDLDRKYQNLFTVVYLDNHLRELLASNSLVPARESSLLSEMATNRDRWNQACVGGGHTRPLPNARALALAAAAPRRPVSFSHRALKTSYPKDDEREQNAAERRRNWLARLPNVYTSGHRQRYVFLNLDNIAGALFSSHTLYRRIDGASSPQDVRLDFRALTELCVASAVVKRQVAVYCKTSPYLARALVDLGWMLKSPSLLGDNKGVHNELLSLLDEGAATTNEKTLVLAMGDGGLGSTKANVYRELIHRFLDQHWYVEIYAWLHALKDGFLELQAQYPGHVVVKTLDDNIDDLVYPKNRETTRAFSAFIKPATVSINRDEPSDLPASSPPQSKIMTLQHQMQQMQDAFTELQSSVSIQGQLKQKSEELEKRMREQAKAFEEERQKSMKALEEERQRNVALVAQQASDARMARRLQLEEREESLTCPITHELYVEPMTTICCGKTFSAVVKNRLNDCPWCRTQNFSTHPNRDIALLAEQYRVEQDQLDAEDQRAAEEIEE